MTFIRSFHLYTGKILYTRSLSPVARIPRKVHSRVTSDSDVCEIGLGVKMSYHFYAIEGKPRSNEVILFHIHNSYHTLLDLVWTYTSRRSWPPTQKKKVRPLRLPRQRVYAYFGVTCHLHFRENDRVILCHCGSMGQERTPERIVGILLVSRCFEPSQPQRITSGPNTWWSAGFTIKKSRVQILAGARQDFLFCS